MAIPLSEALDEARYVSFSDDRRLMAVWYGANRVGVFLVEDPSNIAVVDTVSVGEYRFGETGHEEAEQTIRSVFEEYRDGPR